MTRRTLVPFAVALVGGILAERHGVALGVLACTVLGAFAFQAIRRASSSATIGVDSTHVAVASAFAGGILLGRFHQGLASVGMPSRTAEYTGTVVGQPRVEPFGSTFDVRIDDGPTLETTAPGESPMPGDRLRIRGRVVPLDEARNPGEPSPRTLAADRGIAGRLAHAHIVQRGPPDDRDAAGWLPRIRAWASRTLHDRLDEPGASILAGALWGERGSLPPDVRTEFQDTGTTHILVTAGLHLGVIAALTAWLLALTGVARIPASLATIAVVWTYAAFSGAHLPSLRAATMISFGLTARACGRATFSWNALAAAAIAIGMAWTASVDSLSFALSFSCVAAIMLFAKTFVAALERIGMHGFAGEAVALTLATQLGTWPLTAFAFLVFAPYAPLANALVVPVVGLAMLGGIALLAATPIPLLAHAIANVEGSLLAWIVGVVRFTGSLPEAHVVTTPPPVWAIAAYDCGCVAAAILIHYRRPWFAAATVALGCALVILPPRPPTSDLVVTAIDVGQADSLLIRTPRGHALLVDGGGRLERGADAGAVSPAEAIGERTVAPFLIREGIHHLDAVLLSHPHGEHKGF